VVSLAEAKRQTNGGGPAFNGAFGVDSEDILNIPQVGLGTFQMFPDQNTYSTTGVEVTSPSSDFDTMVQQTNSWIQTQVETALRWVFPSPIRKCV
jgi:mannan endo-1,4-beta-mannosidase